MSKFKVNSDLKDNYDDYYQDGDSYWRQLGAIDKVKNIKELSADLKIDSALEIGAGEGSILSMLSDQKFAKSLYALEISSSGVKNIRNRKIGSLIECHQFDGYNIFYEDNYFDLAILSHVVEHVEHPRQLINEAKRVARYVFIEVPLEDNFMQPQNFSADKVGHINFYSPKTIRRLVQTCGLEVIREKVTNRSKAGYIYQSGNAGIINYYIKQALLGASTRLATNIFTYHGSLICKCG